MFKDLLWKCASATTLPQFEHHMETVRQQDAALYDWLKAIPPEHWSRSHFTGMFLDYFCYYFNKKV